MATIRILLLIFQYFNELTVQKSKRAGGGARTRNPLPWQGNVPPIELPPQSTSFLSLIEHHDRIVAGV